MTRPALGRLLGALTAVAAVLVALAGSDRPPPPGFLAVVGIALVVGVLTALLVPRLLLLVDRSGPLRGLLAALAAGAALGLVLGLLVAMAGPGEPSTPPPGAAETAAFVLVVVSTVAIGAALVAVAATLLDRVSRRDPRRGGG